jgi:GNAT superfamily N-acetyltransferase
MALLEERAKEKGDTALILETGAMMSHAICFYRNVGFHVTENYGHLPRHHRICMYAEVTGIDFSKG